MHGKSPKELLDFAGRVVLVTGSGSGIGSRMALRFAEAGADVLLHFRHSADGARRLAEEVEGLGRRALVLQGDLSQREQVVQVVERGVEGLGGIDVLVNNAGVYPLAPLLEMTDADWDTVIDSNLRATFLCTQAVARHMVETAREGAVVNIASIEAHHPAANHSHYNTAKAGVLMHTRASAFDLGPRGIRVNAVSPGLIWRAGLDEAWPEGVARYRKTVPLGRLGEFEDVADACLFLASPLARWVTGAELVVDGGVMSTPAF